MPSTYLKICFGFLFILPYTAFSHPCEKLLTEACEAAVGADNCLNLVFHLQTLSEENVLVKETVESVSKLADPKSIFSTTHSADQLRGEWKTLRTSFEKVPESVKPAVLNRLDETFSKRLTDIAVSSFGRSATIKKSENLWRVLREKTRDLPDDTLRNQTLDTINREYGQSMVRISETHLGSGSNAHYALESLLAGRTLSSSKLSLANALLENTVTIGGKDLGAKEILEILFSLSRANSDGYGKIIARLTSSTKTPGDIVGHIYHAYVGSKLHRSRGSISVIFEQPVLRGEADLFVRRGMVGGVEQSVLMEAKASLNFVENSRQGIHFQEQLERYFKVLNEKVEIEKGRVVDFVEIHYPGGRRAIWIDNEVKKLNNALSKKLGEGDRIKFVTTAYP